MSDNQSTVVASITNMYSNGVKLRIIADKLNNQGFRQPNGNVIDSSYICHVAKGAGLPGRYNTRASKKASKTRSNNPFDTEVIVEIANSNLSAELKKKLIKQALRAA